MSNRCVLNLINGDHPLVENIQPLILVHRMILDFTSQCRKTKYARVAMIAVNATIDLVAIVEVSFSTYNVSTYEFNMIIIRDNNVLTTDVNGDRMGIVKCEGKVREDVWGLWRYREVIRHPVPKRSDARHRAIASCEKLTPQNHGINKFAYAP